MINVPPPVYYSNVKQIAITDKDKRREKNNKEDGDGENNPDKSASSQKKKPNLTLVDKIITQHKVDIEV